MRTTVANEDLRNMASQRGWFLWELAEHVGVSESTMMKWIRTPLPEGDPRRERILQVLEVEGDGDGTEAEMDGATV